MSCEGVDEEHVIDIRGLWSYKAYVSDTELGIYISAPCALGDD